MARLENCDDEVVERGAPALDAGGDFRGERAVAIVAQAVARERDRRRQVGAAGGDGAEDLVGGDAGRGDHDRTGSGFTVRGSGFWF